MIQLVIVQVLDDFEAFKPSVGLTLLLSTRLQSRRNLKSPRQTLRRTPQRIEIDVPPYEIIAVLTGATLSRLKSLVGFSLGLKFLYNTVVNMIKFISMQLKRCNPYSK